SRRRGAVADRTRNVAPVDILLACDDPPLAATPTVHGVVVVRGWALARPAVAKGEVVVDGGPPGQAEYGHLPPAVGWGPPDYPNADRPAFRWSWDTREAPDGRHTVTLRATAAGGTTRELHGAVVVDNATPRPTDYQRWIEANEPKDLREAQENA